MRSIYSAFVRNKDHFLFFFSLIFSLSLLLNSDNPKMGYIRGKVAEIVTLISSPISWIDFLINVEDENKILREKSESLEIGEFKEKKWIPEANYKFNMTEIEALQILESIVEKLELFPSLPSCAGATGTVPPAPTTIG